MADPPQPRIQRLAQRLQCRIADAVVEAADGEFETAPYVVEAVATDETVKNLVEFVERAADGGYGRRATIDAEMIWLLEDKASGKA